MQLHFDGAMLDRQEITLKAGRDTLVLTNTAQFIIERVRRNRKPDDNDDAEPFAAPLKGRTAVKISDQVFALDTGIADVKAAGAAPGDANGKYFIQWRVSTPNGATQGPHIEIDR